MSAAAGRDPLRPSPLARALAMAGDGLSGAILLGLVGSLAVLGHDGLALLLGLTGGWLLALALTAPHLQHAGHLGPTSFVARRFGRIAAVVAGLIVLAASTVLLAAELAALVTAASAIGSIAAPTALAIAALATLLVSLAVSARGMTRLQAALFPLLAAAISLPVVLPALAAAGVPVPQLTYGAVLQSISTLELKLLGEELADPVSLKAYLRPYTTMTPVGGLLVTLSMALGLAALPHLLMRPVQAATAHHGRWALAVGFVLLLLALLALPPLAAAARHGVLAGLVGRAPGALDPWLLDLGRAGLVKICGVAATSADAVREACEALPDAPPRLRLDDIDIARDATLLALPGLIGLPALLPALAGAVVLAALAAGAWLVVALRDDLAGTGTRHAATAEAVEHGEPEAAARWRRLLAHALTAVVVVAAAAWVSTAPADLATLIAWGLALAAGGLTPALVAGIWWQRATAAGAVIGMLSGVGLTAYYIFATRYFPIGFYETWGALSNAGFGAIADYEAARDALAAAGDAERMDAMAALETEARRIANWWGVRSIGAGVLGAGVGSLLLVIVSAVTPRPSASAQLLVERMRGIGAD